MPEGQPIREVEPQVPIADAVRQIFERRATHGDRKLILEAYQSQFEKVLTTLPKDKRENTSIQIQRFAVKIRGYLSEYTTRFADYVRNIVVWPMISATEDFPKDKYYQMELARAKAWGEFALDTTKTATAERMAYRDHWLPNALTGAGSLGAVGLLGGVTFGALEGAKIGAVVGLGLGGAAVGAAVGGAIGGGMSLALEIKDRILGPPVVYYNLFAGNASSLSINSANANPVSTGVGMVAK